ncbi:5-hydroxytryptamine receptor 5A [Biomphalaria glabrata]|nr:5-hydroxytryptamine receptor 5A [Biomphalaria glabrata]
MMYTLNCDNVSLDLSESSTRFTRHPHLLVAIATGMCLIATLIVVCHLLIIAVLIQHRYHKKYVNRNNKQESMSPVRQKLTISNSLLHLVIAVFCMPLAIAEVVSNGEWTLSSSLCPVRIYVEVLTEVIRVFHSVVLWMEFFVLVRFPMRHRMMKSRSGYGIVVTVWVVPLLLLVVAVSLGWDTDGIGEDLYCLSQANKCVTFFSKKMVLMIFPLTLILCASIVIVMVVIVAFETHRRQGNLNRLNKRSEADSHRLKPMKDTNYDPSDSDIKILAIDEKNSLDVERLVALKHLNKVNDSYGQVVEKTNIDSISVASSNIATSTTASKGLVSINTATSNTASSNTATSNTASSNTATSKTATSNTATSKTATSNTATSNTATSNTATSKTATSNTANSKTATSNTATSKTATSNTATSMTAFTISVSLNADSSLTTSNYSVSINDASSTTASNNSESINAASSMTASTNSFSINAASSTTVSANSVSINTASLNAASLNKASSVTGSNTASNVFNQSEQSGRSKSAEADLTFGSRTHVTSDNVCTNSRQPHSKKTRISQNFIDTSVSTTVNASSVNKKVKAKARKNTKCVRVVILVTVVNCIYLVTSLLISVLLTYDTTLFPLWLISLMTGLRYVVVATMPIYTMRHKYFTKLFCTFKVFTH